MQRYFLGLPAWAFPGWKDRYFFDRPSRLASYAGVFNTVEGNTSFYRVPDAQSVERWRRAVEGTNFRFCFKLPREVTHEPWPDMAVLESFLTNLRPLRAHLGPPHIQFPDTVSPDHLERFRGVFDAVGEFTRFVIEVRHPAFFSTPDALDQVLDEYAADRVVFDSRPLFQGDLDHPEVKAARHKKPDVPVVDRNANGVTMVRLILHPDIHSNERFLNDWVQRTAHKLRTGGTVYMMIHCPNNQHCPDLARTFDERLKRELGADAPPQLPAWPVPQQQTLLGDF
ncbi:MAG: DUF72 domain-containing protein [Gammaproteobacteria bacterium]